MKADWIILGVSLLIFGGAFSQWKRIPKGVKRIVLVSFVLFLLVVANWWKTRSAEKSEAKTKQEEKLVSIDFSTAQRMVVTTKNGRVVLDRRVKKNTGEYEDEFSPFSDEMYTVPEWIIVEPFRSLPEGNLPGDLISDLKNLKRTKVIDETGEKEKDFHLHTPRIRIETFSDPKATPLFTLSVGDDNTAQTGFYIKTSAQPSIFLASKELEPLLERQPTDWRLRKIIGFKSIQEVSSANLSYGKGPTFSFVHKEDRWDLVKPKSLPGDSQEIEKFLDMINYLQTKAIVSEKMSDENRFGFQTPYMTVEFELKGSQGRPEKKLTRKFLVGKQDKHEFYVKRGDLPQIFSVDSVVWEKFKKTQWTDWVRKDLFYLPASEVDQVEIVEKDQPPVQLLKKGETWEREPQPKDVYVKPQKTDELVSELRNLRAQKFLGETFAASTKPLWTVRMRAKQNQEEVAFLQAGEKVVVKRNQPTLYYELAKDQMDKLSSSLAAAISIPSEKTPTTEDSRNENVDGK